MDKNCKNSPDKNNQDKNNSQNTNQNTSSLTTPGRRSMLFPTPSCTSRPVHLKGSP